MYAYCEVDSLAVLRSLYYSPFNNLDHCSFASLCMRFFYCTMFFAFSVTTLTAAMLMYFMRDSCVCHEPD